MSHSKQIKVVELFAGVGGFRVGLEKADKKRFKTVWFNQWEPNKKEEHQHAHHVYQHKWPDSSYLPHTNTDFQKVVSQHLDAVPDHDLLVGGFPCQDYSVTKPLRQSSGLIGKKGVLWWSIVSLIKQLEDTPKRSAPKYLLLENVDRLLKSPGDQRGRDFAVMLRSLDTLGYNVEWRVINAAEYGFPQRRRRIFILAYYRNTPIAKAMVSAGHLSWLHTGIHGRAFPIERMRDELHVKEIELHEDEKIISDTFGKNLKKSPFDNAGVMIDGVIKTAKVASKTKKEKPLKNFLLTDQEVITKYGEEFFIDDPDTIKKWEAHKDAKKVKKISRKSGVEYLYAEGKLSFPDNIDMPARTIITGEGGKSPSRFKHVVKHPESDRLRRLTPIELERISMFPADHTIRGVFQDDIVEMKPTTRAFFIGNALVTGVITKLGKELINSMDEYGF